MKRIAISDVTMRTADGGEDLSLSFREKIELAKLLDRAGVSVIETDPILNARSDALLIKSIASSVRTCTVAVPVILGDAGSVSASWNALKDAVSPRLQVRAPISTVQMEYFHHMKADKMIRTIAEMVAACRKYCSDVEFAALDAGRSDADTLKKAVQAAIEAGATVITYSDTAGTLLPDEFYESVRAIRDIVPENVKLAVHCSDALYMSNSCAMAAVRAGADEVKTVAYGDNAPSLQEFAGILAAKGVVYDVGTGVRVTELNRIVGQIRRMCETHRSQTSPFDTGVREGEEFALGAHEDMQAVRKAAEALGYDLSDEDITNVYTEFSAIAARKEQVTARELDAIVAAVAMQVPPMYQLESYVINSGNVIMATSHLRLKKDGSFLEGIAVGDGPIDASFLAIEQITGRHFELDDFQIRAVTEGREAMGETVVRLRSGGKLYSGRGISTDIIGSGILAYINAVNKIVYEEDAA